MKVNVSPTAEIGELNRITQVISDVQVSFIFMAKGVILSESNTFEFYGLLPNDVIWSIPLVQQNLLDLQTWAARSLDADAFSESLSAMNNCGMSKEMARLRDLQMTRMERRPRTFRKVVDCYKRVIQKQSLKSEIKTESVHSEPLLSPSDEPLPVLWDN